MNEDKILNISGEISDLSDEDHTSLIKQFREMHQEALDDGDLVRAEYYEDFIKNLSK